LLKGFKKRWSFAPKKLEEKRTVFFKNHGASNWEPFKDSNLEVEVFRNWTKDGKTTIGGISFLERSKKRFCNIEAV